MAKIKIEVYQEEINGNGYKLCRAYYRGLDAGNFVVYGNIISQYSIFNYRGSNAALFGSINSIVKNSKL